MTVHGVDFSGAANAGEKIWVASGEVLADTLRILQCRPARQLLGGAADRGSALYALFAFIATERDAVLGIDFPFGLPRALVEQGTWRDFVLAFPRHHPGPEEFKDHCLEATRRTTERKKELKRATDVKARTPFSPYNLRLYRQTYYGIRDVLRPLVQRDQARVLPMQARANGKAVVLEICPRSTLKDLGLSLCYAGPTAAHARNRQQILAAIMAGGVSIRDSALHRVIVGDTEGDALSSVIAATAAFRAVRREYAVEDEFNPMYHLEGYVYV